MRTLRIAMAQMNPTVGDLNRNLHRITTWIRDAKKVNADLVVFPELAITGSPPEDLLLKAQFVADNVRVLNEIAQACRGVVAVIGYVRQGDQRDPDSFRSSMRSAGRPALYNAAGVIADRKVVGSYSKWYLPNHGVCDESRYFLPGRRLPDASRQRNDHWGDHLRRYVVAGRTHPCLRSGRRRGDRHD